MADGSARIAVKLVSASPFRLSRQLVVGLRLIFSLQEVSDALHLFLLAEQLLFDGWRLLRYRK
jgi:hypothetical protein